MSYIWRLQGTKGVLTLHVHSRISPVCKMQFLHMYIFCSKSVLCTGNPQISRHLQVHQMMIQRCRARIASSVTRSPRTFSQTSFSNADETKSGDAADEMLKYISSIAPAPKVGTQTQEPVGLDSLSSLFTKSGAFQNRKSKGTEGGRVGYMDADQYRRDTHRYYLHCLTSHSNTLLTLTNSNHDTVLWTSAGLCGFKKAARGGYEAGFRSTATMLEKMKEKEEADAALAMKERSEPSKVQRGPEKKRKPPFKPREIELIFKDFGLGREAVVKCLLGVEGEHYRTLIKKITDATPLRFGGCRPRAVRRL